MTRFSGQRPNAARLTISESLVVEAARQCIGPKYELTRHLTSRMLSRTRSVNRVGLLVSAVAVYVCVQVTRL